MVASILIKFHQYQVRAILPDLMLTKVTCTCIPTIQYVNLCADP